MRSFSDGSQTRRDFAPLGSDYVDVRFLGVATAEKHTVPTGAKFVVFSSTGDFYARIGDTNVVATVPAADVTDGTASELNPEAREIPSGTGFISLISAAAQTVTMSFFS